MAAHSPDRSSLIQSYMVLHSQQTNVRRRLSQDSTNMSNPESPASSPPSPTYSYATSSRRSSRSSSLHSCSPTRRSSIEPIPELPEDEPKVLAPSNDELKLNDISNRIKMTLTDLLNCDGVRGDTRMRNWVAVRLMDVEHELKESKRRRHSVDMADVDVIATSLRE